MATAALSPSGPAIIDIAGTELTPEDRDILVLPQVAGVILFARNAVDAAQVEQLCAEITGLRQDLLICIDQEGGRVQRLRSGVTRLPAMAQLGRAYAADHQSGLELARSVGWLMARELRALGVHLSFAPVLDLDTDFCPAIGDRSFGCRPEQVTAVARAFIAGMGEAGMAAVGKHFPGHGKVSTDSHYGLPVDSRCLEQIAGDDMLPFAQLCHDQLQGIMPAHIVFDQVDTKAVGFSRIWLQQILRQQLGYQGLIFSDDLTMAAAQSAGDYVSRSRAALAAGCDLLLLCNNRSAAIEVLDSLADTRLPREAACLKRQLIGALPQPLSAVEAARQEAIQCSLSVLSEGASE